MELHKLLDSQASERADDGLELLLEEDSVVSKLVADSFEDVELNQ